MHDLFRRFSGFVSRAIASFWTFLLAIILIAGTGTVFNYSDAWKSNLNSILHLSGLLLLIFLQRALIHSEKATHLKLDELIQATKGARNELASVEKKAEHHIENLRQRD